MIAHSQSQCKSASTGMARSQAYASRIGLAEDECKEEAMEKKRLGMGVTVVALCGVLAGGMALVGCTGTAPAGDAGEKPPQRAL